MLRTASQSARFIRMTSWSRVMPGVVYQDVDLAELCDDGLERGFDLLFVADVERKSRGITARSRDFSRQRLQLFLATRRQRESRTCLSKFHSASPADALRCARHQCNPACKSHGFSSPVELEIITGENVDTSVQALAYTVFISPRNR